MRASKNIDNLHRKKLKLLDKKWLAIKKEKSTDKITKAIVWIDEKIKNIQETMRI